MPLVEWSALVILSTMTTGLHYFVDVIAGIAIAAAALILTEKVLRRSPQEAVPQAVALPSEGVGLGGDGSGS